MAGAFFYAFRQQIEMHGEELRNFVNKEEK
jgi:hypothetical protein